MSFPYSRKSKSQFETIKIATDFARLIEDGMIVCLNGELGAGKTFFVKQVLLHFDFDRVNSPTFAIVNEYNGKKKFYHFDFYRINKESELIDIGIDDYFKDKEAISFIEWANLFPNILPEKRIEINISFTDENTRLFNFIKYD
jgi:tRNA threonylcarbamoyladenosine biosynthesis protein TsaE